MELLQSETVGVTTPSGYLVTLKKKLTYGEQQEITNDLIGDTEVGQDADNFRIKLKQASGNIPMNILKHVVSWDITDKSGILIPVTIENIKLMFEDDINFLTKEIKGFKIDSKKETGSL